LPNERRFSVGYDQDAATRTRAPLWFVALHLSLAGQALLLGHCRQLCSRGVCAPCLARFVGIHEAVIRWINLQAGPEQAGGISLKARSGSIAWLFISSQFRRISFGTRHLSTIVRTTLGTFDHGLGVFRDVAGDHQRTESAPRLWRAQSASECARGSGARVSR
jgi:hypothetical protein